MIPGGERVKLQVAHTRLSHSRAFIVRAYLLRPHEMLFDAPTRAFRAAGGVPWRGVFDNMKTAVDRIGSGKARQVNARFAAMAGHDLFEPAFCNPASGWEKGRVGKNVQDARRRLWQPLPGFSDPDALNARLEERCIEQWGRIRHGGLPGTVADVPAGEVAGPMPPGRPFDGLVEHTRRVSPTCLVHFERNRYSVPASFANRQMSLRVYPAQAGSLVPLPGCPTRSGRCRPVCSSARVVTGRWWRSSRWSCSMASRPCSARPNRCLKKVFPPGPASSTRCTGRSTPTRITAIDAPQALEPRREPRRPTRPAKMPFAARRALLRHDPASAAVMVMLRSVRMYGMARAVGDLIEQGTPAFDTALPILSQMLKAEVAEREVRSIACRMKAARFPACKVPAPERPISLRPWASGRLSIIAGKYGSSPPSTRSTCSNSKRP